jgi:hypothetical protein
MKLGHYPFEGNIDFIWVFPAPEFGLCPNGHKAYKRADGSSPLLLCECGGKVIE